MKKKDFDLFKIKYGDQCRTKSTNPSILEVYALILKYEDVDSDFWHYMGNDFCIQLLEYYFSVEDWPELKTDLKNWTTDQLELFTTSICLGEGIFDKENASIKRLNEFGGINYIYSSNDGESIMDYRIGLLPELIEIAKERGRFKNEIILTISEEGHNLKVANPELFKEATADV